MKTLLIAALIASAACSKKAEEPKQEPAPVQESVEISTKSAETTLDVSQYVMDTEKEAEEPADTEAQYTAGICYSGGTVIWSGKATDFNNANTTTWQRFMDQDSKKGIQIEGSFVCVWNLD